MIKHTSSNGDNTVSLAKYEETKKIRSRNTSSNNNDRGLVVCPLKKQKGLVKFFCLARRSNT